ncbi:MAG: sulfatase-like hydrolase/transferase, partial [Verrucomicrobiota bacterium]
PGGLLDTLDELDLTDDTLVIYTADNGPQLGIGGEDHSSGIYRDGKWTNFEGGIRVPCFMRWPGTIAANSTNHEITKIYDLLPTFCELTKIPSPSDRVIDGRSLLPYILGKEVDPPIHESFLVNGSTFRYQHWKLFRKRITPGGQEKYWGPRTPTDEGSLYHLKDDPSETHDVSQRHPEIVQELSRRMDLAMDELAQNSRPIGKTADYSLEKVAEMRQKKERKSKEKQ